MTYPFLPAVYVEHGLFKAASILHWSTRLGRSACLRPQDLGHNKRGKLGRYGKGVGRVSTRVVEEESGHTKAE